MKRKGTITFMTAASVLALMACLPETNSKKQPQLSKQDQKSGQYGQMNDAKDRARPVQLTRKPKMEEAAGLQGKLHQPQLHSRNRSGVGAAAHSGGKWQRPMDRSWIL